MPCKNKIMLRHHAKKANCTLLLQEVTQSHAKDLRDLLHGMHPGPHLLYCASCFVIDAMVCVCLDFIYIYMCQQITGAQPFKAVTYTINPRLHYY